MKFHAISYTTLESKGSYARIRLIQKNRRYRLETVTFPTEERIHICNQGCGCDGTGIAARGNLVVLGHLNGETRKSVPSRFHVYRKI